MSNPQSMRSDAADLAQWNFPDSEVCLAAYELVVDASPEYLSNHCVRSYLFAREIAAVRGMRGGVDYADETLYLACLLHDLGLTGYGSGDQRFEVQGADAAVRFLRGYQVSEEAVTTIWQSIALHSSLGLVNRFGTVQALAGAGISLDIDGVGKEDHSSDLLGRINRSWPRHDAGHELGQAVALDVRKHPGNPLKAPPFTLPGHLNETVNAVPALRFADVVANSGWGDRPTTS